jgi:hypothetical protein
MRWSVLVVKPQTSCEKEMLIMSNALLTLAIIIGVVFFIYIFTRPSEKDYEDAKRREEYEIDSIRLAKERRDAELEARIPPGRGKTVNARRR